MDLLKTWIVAGPTEGTADLLLVFRLCVPLMCVWADYVARLRAYI